MCFLCVLQGARRGERAGEEICVSLGKTQKTGNQHNKNTQKTHKQTQTTHKRTQPNKRNIAQKKHKQHTITMTVAFLVG